MENKDNPRQYLDASFIVPVSNDKRFNRLADNITEKYKGIDIIPVTKATSMFDAWRKGLAQVTRNHVILTHEDTTYHRIPSLSNQFKDGFGLIGVFGSKVITKNEPWLNEPVLKRFFLQEYSGLLLVKAKGPLQIPAIGGRYGEVVALDGVCLATPSEVIDRVGIPNKDWATWDFYDHVFSLHYRDAGYRLKTAPIILTHDTGTIKRKDRFLRTKARFVEEYFKTTDHYKV